MRRLIRCDPGGWLTEIDTKALRREAQTLAQYVAGAPKSERQLHRYDERVMPLVTAALDGTLQVPFKGPDPYPMRLIWEDLMPALPKTFNAAFFPFMLRISGSATRSDPTYLASGKIEDYRPQIVEKDGVQYQWVEFED